MRILFLNYEYPPLGGGAANANAYLLEAYAEYPDLTVDLVTSSPDPEAHMVSLSENIKLHLLPIGKTKETLHHQSQKDLLVYSFKAYRLAQKLMRENEYDVIHAFFTVPCGVLAWRLGKQKNIPYIVSLRGSDVPGYSERFSALYTFLTPLITKVWAHASQVVSNSSGLRELALRSAPEQPIAIIPNGVDTKKFTPETPVQEEWIITAGATRVTERKGLDLIIRALPVLLQVHPQLVFEIMGEGSALESLGDLVTELGVEKNVRFLGRIPSSETPQYYGRAKVFILPSANEGMSNALLEALASGLPVIVTDTGGSQELVQEGENGYIIERESEAIIVAVRKLLADEALRVSMGQKSRARAVGQSWAQVAEQYVQLYRKVVTKKNE